MEHSETDKQLGREREKDRPIETKREETDKEKDDRNKERRDRQTEDR